MITSGLRQMRRRRLSKEGLGHRPGGGLHAAMGTFPGNSDEIECAGPLDNRDLYRQRPPAAKSAKADRLGGGSMADVFHMCR
jgi:hypothetical protein